MMQIGYHKHQIILNKKILFSFGIRTVFLYLEIYTFSYFRDYKKIIACLAIILLIFVIFYDSNSKKV